MLHYINEHGLTVSELHKQLGEAVVAGEGSRNIMIGPTTGEESGSEPLAAKVVGIEANDEDGENDVYWLYPGPDEF